MSYYFKPMMPFYNRFISASTEALMSQDVRSLIAKTIIHCRNVHGREEAKRFYSALIVTGIIYPQIFPKC